MWEMRSNKMACIYFYLECKIFMNFREPSDDFKGNSKRREKTKESYIRFRIDMTIKFPIFYSQNFSPTQTIIFLKL